MVYLLLAYTKLRGQRMARFIDEVHWFACAVPHLQLHSFIHSECVARGAEV